MKKLRILSLFLIILILPGCAFNEPEYIKNSTKPNNYFYTNEIYAKLKNNEKFTLEVFDTDVYKYYPVPEDDYDVILSFIESMHSENYHDELTEDQKKLIPIYKINIKFDNSKFVMNIYNSNLATIYPWDGVFTEDIVSFENVPSHFNPYEFCLYVENKTKENK